MMSKIWRSRNLCAVESVDCEKCRKVETPSASISVAFVSNVLAAVGSKLVSLLANGNHVSRAATRDIYSFLYILRLLSITREDSSTFANFRYLQHAQFKFKSARTLTVNIALFFKKEEKEIRIIA